MSTEPRVFVIAEAGVNHNGSPDLALKLVDAAAEAGADAVKFQTFRPEALVSRYAPKAEYQQRTTGNSESQLDMLRQLALSDTDHRTLAQHCMRRGIEFMSSPFDLASAAFLVLDMKLQRLKLGSGEITNAPLLLAVARSGRPLILSTGMSTLEDVEQALRLLAFGYVEPASPPQAVSLAAAYGSEAGRAALRRNVTLLHCTTEYPCPLDEVNLRAMDTLRETFGLAVGYSDHTEGYAVSLAAVARGARVIEKHFTLDRGLPGPDHLASLEPDELGAMVRGIREIETALGSGTKQPSASEVRNQRVARKSLVAARAIAKGEALTADNLTVKRPGDGIPALRYWDYLGRPAARDYAADELIDP